MDVMAEADLQLAGELINKIPLVFCFCFFFFGFVVVSVKKKQCLFWSYVLLLSDPPF